jgi:predicted dehydrogenase
VHLCTPPGLHKDQAITALRGGAHVVCEKPPVLSLADLDAVLEVAREVGREYAVVFQQRTGTAVGHVQRLLAEGTLGRPLVGVCHTLWYRKQEDYYAVPWRGKWATEGGGPLLGLGIHQLDLLGFLLGEWAEVDARAFRLDRDLETEDTSTAVIRFANDAIVSVLTTALSPRQVSYVRVDTTLGTVEVEHLYGHDARSWRLTAAPDRTGADAPEPPAAWTLPSDDEPSGHTPLLRAVYAALRAGEPLPPVASDPHRSLELVTAIYASAALGRPVTKADLAPGSTLRDGFLHGVEDLRPATA